MSATAMADTAAWDERRYSLLCHLLDVAEARSNRARDCAVSLQERMVKVGGVAAALLGLMVNAAGLMSPPAAILGLLGLLLAGVGVLSLAVSLCVATAGFRPQGEDDLGKVDEWRAYLGQHGAGDCIHALLVRHEEIMDNWEPRLKWLARLALRAQVSLALGVTATSIGLFVLAVTG